VTAVAKIIWTLIPTGLVTPYLKAVVQDLLVKQTGNPAFSKFGGELVDVLDAYNTYMQGGDRKSAKANLIVQWHEASAGMEGVLMHLPPVEPPTEPVGTL
jgi:hypothetical protein